MNKGHLPGCCGLFLPMKNMDIWLGKDFCMPGLYLHVPFCDGKCPYCDFYSMAGNEALKEEYTRRLEKLLPRWAEKLREKGSGFRADTLYFGGGTPNLLGASRIARLVRASRQNFGLKNGEITLEANPTSRLDDFFQEIAHAGVNRLSLGLQSAHEEELKLLGRRHTARQAAEAVKAARKAGFRNISLDLMMALPGQTWEKLRESIRFCASLGVEHISAYLLKIEPGTPFWGRKDNLELPGEEETCTLYLSACEELERLGYRQYEISNFAKPGFEGRHNLQYWRCDEYLGLGPAAHSFVMGKRFFYPRDLQAFLAGNEPRPDGEGGSPEEFCMLALRLREGLSEESFSARYAGKASLPEEFWREASLLEKGGLCRVEGERGKRRLSLTPQGFLVSNSVILELVERICEGI